MKAARAGLFIAMLGLGARAIAATEPSEPWIGAAPFTVAPADIMAAIGKLPVPDASAELLLEENRFDFDESSRAEHRYHVIYRVLNSAGQDARSHFSVAWSPWRQARPDVRARVISADGVTHELDPSTIADAPLGSEDEDVFSDRRVVEGPLPAVAPGSIVEIAWTLRDTERSPSLGSSGRWVIGDNVPVRHTVFAMTAPASLPLVCRLYNLGSLNPVRDEQNGRVTISLEVGPQPKLPDVEAWVPYDVRQIPAVGWATAGTWSRVAAEYASIVDRQVASAKVGSTVDSALRGVSGRLPRLEALVRALHRQIRYTGVEFGESSITPARPEETLKRRFGDCKDKSALLVAMARAAGFDAHIALLDTGFTPDVDADLPGVDQFDHAIVVVNGEPPVWIDATAEYLRVGDLPAAVAGRQALVASGSTTGLERIPDTPASRNRLEHARDYFLVERGRSRAVETVTPEGAFEGEFRGRYAAMDEGDVKKNLDEYVKRVFKARTLGEVQRTAATDFSKPFVISCEARESSVGESFADASNVRFPAADFVDRLEDALPAEKKENGTEGDAPRVRKLPFRLKEAFVDVWTTRVHPAPGFVPGEAPQVEDTHVGPVHFTRIYSVGADGTMAFRATLDTGDRLTWTPDELAQVRAWVTKVKAGDSVQLIFEQAGYKALRAGKLQEAVSEYQKLTKLHPTEALHHAQLSEAYLNAGLGEAARAEARDATTLDPGSADAWRSYGWAYVNDLIGRPFMSGSDLAEAARAYRKATELDPKDQLARRNLAIILEYDARTMERYGSGAHLPEAIDVWRARKKDLDTKDGDTSLMVTLARAERWKELLEFAGEAQGAETRSAWLVIATAVLSGTDEAIGEAGRRTTSRDERDKLLFKAGATLAQVRHYAEASELLRAGAQASDQGTAATMARVDLFRRCKRHEDISMGGDTPEDFLRRFILDVLLSDDAAKVAGSMVMALPPDDDRSALDRARGGQLAGLRQLTGGSGLTMDAVVDVILAAADWRTEGSDAVGYKVDLKVNVPGDSRTLEFFLRRLDGTLKIVGFGNDVSSIGPVALSLVEAGQPDAARQWLTWAHDALPAARADLVEDSPFMAFWPPDPSAGDDGLKLAAAALSAGGPDASKGLPILEQARRSATGQDAVRLDHALRTAYWSLHRRDESIAPARRLLDALPSSDVAFQRLAGALLANMRLDELAALCDERAKDKPDDPYVLRFRSGIAEKQRRWDDAVETQRRLVTLGKADANDYNTLAWTGLFARGHGPQVVDDAEHAALFQKNPSWHVLQTLATAYADVGRVVEARQTLVKQLVASGRDEPGPYEWLVIGRIAQQFGADKYARAAYLRVAKPKDEADLIGSSYALAQSWMADLPAAPTEAVTGHSAGKVRPSRR